MTFKYGCIKCGMVLDDRADAIGHEFKVHGMMGGCVTTLYNGKPKWRMSMKDRISQSPMEYPDFLMSVFMLAVSTLIAAFLLPPIIFVYMVRAL